MTNTINLIKQHKRLIQGVLGTILIAIVILYSNPARLYNQLIDAPLRYLIPCFLIYYLLVTLTWGIGIYLLLRRIKPGNIRLIIESSFKLQVISVIAPGRLGDLGILYYLKDQYSAGQLSAIFFIDKLITLGINIILSIIGIGVLFSWDYTFIISTLLIIIFFLLIWCLFRFPQELISWGFLKNIIDRLQGFRVELRATVRDLKGITGNFLLTLVRYILTGVCMALVLLWFGENAALLEVILIQAVSQLATFIPLTTMGLGVTEVVCVSLFRNIGITSEIILAALLLSRAIHLAFIVLIYFLWIGTPVFLFRD
jgi:uncharacterized protein (TIRG00374 family)